MLNELLKNRMKEFGYDGPYDLRSLFDLTDIKTIFKKDDGTYSCCGGLLFIGIVEGYKSPEDACAVYWLRKREDEKYWKNKEQLKKQKRSKSKLNN